MRISVIPARGGSVRIPRKNIRLFHGRPIITYSINTARRSGLFDRVIVSTEDEEIAEISQAAGADIIMRPLELTRDDVGTQEVTRHVCGLVPADYACCIYATAPLMREVDLQDGFLLLQRPRTSFVVSVGTEPLQDAGQWYWGRAESFIEQEPLWQAPTGIYPLPAERVCDINAEDDWQRAERLYEAMIEARSHSF